MENGISVITSKTIMHKWCGFMQVKTKNIVSNKSEMKQKHTEEEN